MFHNHFTVNGSNQSLKPSRTETAVSVHEAKWRQRTGNNSERDKKNHKLVLNELRAAAGSPPVVPEVIWAEMKHDGQQNNVTAAISREETRCRKKSQKWFYKQHKDSVMERHVHTGRHWTSCRGQRHRPSETRTLTQKNRRRNSPFLFKCSRRTAEAKWEEQVPKATVSPSPVEETGEAVLS